MNWEERAKAPGGVVEWAGRDDKGTGQQSRGTAPHPPPAPTEARTHLVPRQPRAGDQQLLWVSGAPALPLAQVEEHHGRLQLSQSPSHLGLENQLEPQLHLRFPLHWNGGDTAVNPLRPRGVRKGLGPSTVPMRGAEHPGQEPPG